MSCSWSIIYEKSTVSVLSNIRRLVEAEEGIHRPGFVNRMAQTVRWMEARYGQKEENKKAISMKRKSNNGVEPPRKRGRPRKSGEEPTQPSISSESKTEETSQSIDALSAQYGRPSLLIRPNPPEMTDNKELINVSAMKKSIPQLTALEVSLMNYYKNEKHN